MVLSNLSFDFVILASGGSPEGPAFEKLGKQVF
jgi:hypothetical protein